jgi:hypothetical protein
MESPGVRLYKECALVFWSCMPTLVHEAASGDSREVEPFPELQH